MFGLWEGAVMDLMDKLTVLAEAARYDAACTSSGVNRRGRPGASGRRVLSLPNAGASLPAFRCMRVQAAVFVGRPQRPAGGQKH